MQLGSSWGQEGHDDPEFSSLFVLLGGITVKLYKVSVLSVWRSISVFRQKINHSIKRMCFLSVFQDKVFCVALIVLELAL